MRVHRPVLLPVFAASPYYRKVTNTQNGALIGAWPLWEAAGRLAADLRGLYTADQELLTNGGFETAGAGGADIWADVYESVGNGALADEVTLVHGGSHAAKLTAGASANTSIRLYDGLTPTEVQVRPGDQCTLSFWTRGDGTNQGRYSVYNNTNGAFIRSTVATGVPGTDYAQVSYSFTVPAGCYSINVNLVCSSVNTGVCYFDDVSLTVAQYKLNGVYQPAGITYGVDGIGDGKSAIRCNGTDTAVLIGNRAFDSFWNGNVGSAIAWGKVDAAARWDSEVSARYLFHVKSRLDATVYIVFGKPPSSANNLFWRRRVAGATYEKQTACTTTDWFCMGFSWDMVSSPKVFKGYLYLKETDTWSKVFDEEPAAGTGDQEWVNATYPADGFDTVLMAGSLTAQEWIGDGAHCYLWAGAMLSDAEMQRIMRYT